MARKLGVGIVGCGNISTTYFNFAPLFKGIEVRACADINPAASKARSEEFGVEAQEIDALLANPAVDVVVNGEWAKLGTNEYVSANRLSDKAVGATKAAGKKKGK